MSKTTKMSDLFKNPKRSFGKKEGSFVAPFGYIVYHGTNSENVDSILKHGLTRNVPGGPEPQPDHRGTMPSNIICFTEELDVTEDYGDATIADLSGMKIDRFFDEGEAGGVWEVQVEGPIFPDRLKQVR
jgi:hypothetical protein